MSLPDRLIENRRERVLVGLGALLLVAAAVASYLINPQAKALRSALQARDQQAGVVTDNPGLEQALAMQSGVVESLREKLHGDMDGLPPRETEAFIVGRLQSVSWRNGVELQSVEPTDGEDIESFRELLFKVQLAGHYEDLYGWLNELRDELGFFVVKEYRIERSANEPENPPLSASLTLAAYLEGDS